MEKINKFVLLFLPNFTGATVVLLNFKINGMLAAAIGISIAAYLTHSLIKRNDKV